jgi:hypothetical protein
MATEFSQSGAPSVHARLMGKLEDPWVCGAVSRVNGARVDRLAATYRGLGLGKRQARHRAHRLRAYVGLLQMARESPKAA